MMRKILVYERREEFLGWNGKTRALLLIYIIFNRE